MGEKAEILNLIRINYQSQAEKLGQYLVCNSSVFSRSKRTPFAKYQLVLKKSGNPVMTKRFVSFIVLQLCYQ